MMLWVTTWFPDVNHPVRGTFIDAHWKAFKARQPSCRLLFVDVSPASRCLTINLKGWVAGARDPIRLLAMALAHARFACLDCCQILCASGL